MSFLYYTLPLGGIYVTQQYIVTPNFFGPLRQFVVYAVSDDLGFFI